MKRQLVAVPILTCLLVAEIALADQLPHIILVMADDHGYGDTGFTGHPFVRTPHLDAMSEAGVVFNRFYASAPVCSPTRASVMTGRHPFRANVPNHGHYMRPHETTIAEALKHAGYVTGHFGKWHLGHVPGRVPTDQGFDEWWSAGNWYDIGHEYIYHNGEQVPPRDGDTSDVLMDVALEWIGRQAKTDKPFLALIWFPSPHGPFEAKEKYTKPYLQYGEKKANYYGELAGVDHAMGRLRRALRDMRIADNTMLWFNSDNGGYGPATDMDPLWGYKGNYYEGGIRVPFFVHWPGVVAPGGSSAEPVIGVDVYPTLLDIAGAQRPDQPLDGVSLLPLLRGEVASLPRRPLFWHFPAYLQSYRTSVLEQPDHLGPGQGIRHRVGRAVQADDAAAPADRAEVAAAQAKVRVDPLRE